jgi:hypothetical protein
MGGVYLGLFLRPFLLAVLRRDGLAGEEVAVKIPVEPMKERVSILVVT